LIGTAASSAFSHEDEEHDGNVMGTVTAVHKEMKHVVVQATDGHVTAFMVDDKTTFTRGNAAASFEDVKVGDRIVAAVAGEDEHRTATSVKLSAGSAGADSVNNSQGASQAAEHYAHHH